MLQVCVNGVRTRAEHAGLPVSPAELAAVDSREYFEAEGPPNNKPIRTPA
jgi:uncharacterized protein (DUF849 family)